MTKKTIATFICLALISAPAAYACAGKNHKYGHDKAPQNETPSSDKSTVQPSDELSGNICMPYKYTSEADKAQVLGSLKSKTRMESSISDVNPSEDLVQESNKTIKAAPVKKVKKAKIKKLKVEAVNPKKEVQNAPSSTVEPQKPTTDLNAGADAYQEKSAQTSPTSPIPAESAPAPKATLAPENKEVQPQATEPKSTAPSTAAGRITSLEFSETEIELSETQQATLNQLAEDLKTQPNSIIKLHSIGYANQGNSIESRRNALQRSIKVRKYLIDNGVNPNDITVNISDDVTNKTNKVEITVSSR